MTATNHAITGAVVAIVAPSLWNWSWPLVLTVALLSHFICDAIPHWNYGVKPSIRKYVIGLDVLIASLLIGILINKEPLVSFWLIIISAFLAILPDAMWLPNILTGKPIRFDGKGALYLARRAHHWTQWSETRTGFAVEVVWFLLIISIISGTNHGA